MPIEVEMRARFDEKTYRALLDQLAAQATDLGADDKQIHFYTLEDKLIKVVDNVSQGSAKMVMKTERIGRGSVFPEIEISIKQDDIVNAVRFLDELELSGSKHTAFTHRRNYRFLDVDIAVKWSEAWGYHAEFEVLLDTEHPTEAEVTAAQARIREVANQLDVVLMTEEQLAEFTRAFEESLNTT
jgi:adenylate cyclase class IV